MLKDFQLTHVAGVHQVGEWQLLLFLDGVQIFLDSDSGWFRLIVFSRFRLAGILLVLELFV